MKKLIKKVFSLISRFILNFWREICFYSCIVGFVTVAYYFTFERPENIFAVSFMILGMLAFAAGAYIFFRLLWKKKWRDSTVIRIQKVFDRIQRWVERVSTKLGLNNREKKSVLEGKTKIIFEKSVSRETKKHTNEVRPPKWSRLQSNRDRVRYLYRGMTTEKIRHGERIYCFDTPSELLAKQEKGSDEEKLIEVYVSCRYDERKEPDAKKVSELKRKLDI